MFFHPTVGLSNEPNVPRVLRLVQANKSYTTVGLSNEPNVPRVLRLVQANKSYSS